MNLFQTIKAYFTEMALAADAPSRFHVDYYATTRSPKGVSSRFDITSSVDNIPGMGRSETAVKSYLERRHPCCDIQINSLEWVQ